MDLSINPVIITEHCKMNDKHKAQNILCNRPIWLTYEKIEEETGLPVGWLTMLKRGKIKSPDPQRLTILLNYLETTIHANKY